MKINQDLLRSVKGFLDQDEGRCLYEMALKACSLGPCLEIGSYCGKSTLYLAAACREKSGILFSIDHHRGSEEQQPGEEYFDPELFDAQAGRVDTFERFRATIENAEIEDTVVPIVCRSEVAARKWATPLSLVFIDGGHAFETVFTDYTAWAGHIISGGYLLVHDIFADPAKGGQAPYHIYNLALASDLFREITMVKSLGVLQRKKYGHMPANLLQHSPFSKKSKP
ncbi:MAG: class I SAM-dependent methyltransferase [Desulfobacteraceae bacterium]|jgi:predicted O-methyltransferase YrrM|nr:class I SAM-dependent methyltransferase [Desulfobacteraceae bacterium]